MFGENKQAAEIAAAMKLDQLYTLIEKGLSQFQGASRIEGAGYRVAGGREHIYNGRARLRGWSVRAVGGAVTVDLYNGRNNTGDPVASFEVASGASSTKWFGTSGIGCPDGLYLEASGVGKLRGSVYVNGTD